MKLSRAVSYRQLPRIADVDARDLLDGDDYTYGILPRIQPSKSSKSSKSSRSKEGMEYTPFGWQKARPPPRAPFEYEEPPETAAAQPEAAVAPLPAAEEPATEKVEEEPTEPETQERKHRAAPRFHMYDDFNLEYQRHTRKRRGNSWEDLEENRQSQALDQEDTASQPRRLGRSIYDAIQTHGHFGLVDGGETLSGGVRRIVVHVPKRNRGYALDIKPGEVIYANSARGRPVRGRLDVLFVSRHKYVSPGHAVTSCVIGVSESQWRRFVE